MLPLGMSLLFVGGFAIWMMNVTQVIPRSFLRQDRRKEHDPNGWKRSLVIYGGMAGVGVLMILASVLAASLGTASPVSRVPSTSTVHPSRAGR